MTPNITHQSSARDERPAPAAPRKSFRATQFEAREEAILDVTNRLLSDKGYELMSMDDIATEVGIAKGSLYKHFVSKEALAAAVMLRLLRRTDQALSELPEPLDACERLRALLEWVLRERLAGGVPHLPSTSQPLRESLTRNREYVDLLIALSERIGGLIQQARAEGAIARHYRDEFLLYHFYSRTCDPTLDFLREGGALTDDEIISQMVSATFEGIAR